MGGHVWMRFDTLNVSVSCLDRRAAARHDAAAIIWEGDDPADTRTLSFAELLTETCRFANVLREHGVRRGDRDYWTE